MYVTIYAKILVLKRKTKEDTKRSEYGGRCGVNGEGMPRAAKSKQSDYYR